MGNFLCWTWMMDMSKHLQIQLNFSGSSVLKRKRRVILSKRFHGLTMAIKGCRSVLMVFFNTCIFGSWFFFFSKICLLSFYAETALFQVWYPSHGANPFRQEDFLQVLILLLRSCNGFDICFGVFHLLFV